MFSKKYRTRFITFLILNVLLALYVFVGAISIEWKYSHKTIADISSCTFIAINCLLLLLVNYEIIKLHKNKNWNVISQVFVAYMLIILTYLIPVQNSYSALNYAPYKWINFNWLESWMVMLMYFFIFLAYFAIMFIAKNVSWTECFITFIFSLYIACAFKAMSKFMLEQQYGWTSVLWLSLIIILTDTFAFAGGVSYGKHKLAPEISPNKTWEGAITGTVCSSIISILYAVLLYIYKQDYAPFDWYGVNDVDKAKPYIIYVVLAIFLSIGSQVGDLSFSLIKRRYGIKDFSKLLPGHGGILDRLDSFSFVFVTMYIFSLFVG